MIHGRVAGALVAVQVIVLAGGCTAAVLAQPDSWTVSIGESKETNQADDAAASACGQLPGVSNFVVLLSNPGSIAVSGEGSRQRASRVAACLEQVPHMEGRSVVTFTPAHVHPFDGWFDNPDAPVSNGG